MKMIFEFLRRGRPRDGTRLPFVARSGPPMIGCSPSRRGFLESADLLPGPSPGRAETGLVITRPAAIPAARGGAGDADDPGDLRGRRGLGQGPGLSRRRTA